MALNKDAQRWNWHSRKQRLWLSAAEVKHRAVEFFWSQNCGIVSSVLFALACRSCGRRFALRNQLKRWSNPGQKDCCCALLGRLRLFSGSKTVCCACYRRKTNKVSHFPFGNRTSSHARVQVTVQVTVQVPRIPRIPRSNPEMFWTIQELHHCCRLHQRSITCGGQEVRHEAGRLRPSEKIVLLLLILSLGKYRYTQ